MKKLILFVLMALAVQHAFATGFTVTNTNDAGTGSLRQAILDANSDLSATASSPHQINISASGTLSLQAALPDINNHMVITGSATSANVFIINAGTGRRGFHISSGNTVTLRYLEVRNGTVNSVNGGAILNEGTLTIDNCYFHDNSVIGTGEGGAIANESGATLNLANSTLSLNSSLVTGGAIVNNGTANLVNCTIFNNTAPTAGGIKNTLALNILNCTIVSNSGEGVYHNSNVSASSVIQNSIILGNSSNDIYATLTYLMNASYSAIGTSGNTTFTGSGNITSTNTTAIFGTVSLADNGGFTNTIAIPVTSAVKDAGSATNAPSTDQRGMARDASPDMGAYEFQDATPVFGPSASQSGVTLTSNPGNGLYDAILSEQLNGDFQWKVMDSNGRLVKEGGSFSKNASVYTLQINITDQASGAYYLLLHSDKGNYSQMLIKQ